MASDDLSAMSRRRFLGTAAITGGLLSTGVPATVGARPANLSDEVTVETGITYANREAGEKRTGGPLKLDLYLPPGSDSAPLIVFIHGGAWTRKNRRDTLGVERFAERGYAVASIEYRLSYIPEDVDNAFWIPDSNEIDVPRGQFPDHIVDVKASIRWLRAHADEYDLDPDRFATWGSSAGAHLATLAGTMGNIEEVQGSLYDVDPSVYPEESGRVHAVVGWYPPTEFLVMDEQAGRLGAFRHEDADSPESLLVGGDINENALAVRRANPLTYVDFNDPPVLLMHGRRDPIVPYQQSELLIEALGRACVESTLYVLDPLDHGFGFGALENVAADEQTLYRAGDCDPGEHDGSPTAPTRIEGPRAGEAAIDSFLQKHLNSEPEPSQERCEDDHPDEDNEDDTPGRGIDGDNPGTGNGGSNSGRGNSGNDPGKGNNDANPGKGNDG